MINFPMDHDLNLTILTIDVQARKAYKWSRRGSILRTAIYVTVAEA